VGLKATDWIVMERAKNGEYTSIENFIERVFKYKLKKYQYWDDPDNEEEAVKCPVNARHVLHLILAGCFDKVERAYSPVERYAIILKAANLLGFEVKEQEFPKETRSKNYFWQQLQIKLSGVGSVDYRHIYNESDFRILIKSVPYRSIKEVMDGEENKRVAMCASVVDSRERTYTSKKTGKEGMFAVLTLQQNSDTIECTVWQEDYERFREQLTNVVGKVIIFTAMTRFSNYSNANNISFYKSTQLSVL
jgi:DNA polymerase-3 subunit alpha